MNISAACAWQADFLQCSALFEPLRAVGGDLAMCADWPELADLQRLAEQLGTQHEQPLRFVPQGDKPQCFEDEYEPRIYLTGEVQTRTHNWHDLFNALVWLAFPQAKAAINARHYAELLRERAAAGGRVRGKARDRLTQFDESGVVILCADAQLAEMLVNHQWQQLFWDNRARVMQAMRFLVFGHSLYEKALRPYPGITGKGLVLHVEEKLLDEAMGEIIRRADQLLADVIADAGGFGAQTRLQPLPLLGVPGWAADNAQPEYYADTRYFRPKAV